MTVSFLQYLIDNLFGGCNKPTPKSLFDKNNDINKQPFFHENYFQYYSVHECLHLPVIKSVSVSMTF